MTNKNHTDRPDEGARILFLEDLNRGLASDADDMEKQITHLKDLIRAATETHLADQLRIAALAEELRNCQLVRVYEGQATSRLCLDIQDFEKRNTALAQGYIERSRTIKRLIEELRNCQLDRVYEGQATSRLCLDLQDFQKRNTALAQGYIERSRTSKRLIEDLRAAREVARRPGNEVPETLATPAELKETSADAPNPTIGDNGP